MTREELMEQTGIIEDTPYEEVFKKLLYISILPEGERYFLYSNLLLGVKNDQRRDK